MLKNNEKTKLICATLLSFFLMQNQLLAQEVKEKEEEKKYKISIDLGATITNGNNKEESLQSNLKFDYKFNEKISNTLKARGENKKANKVRIREKYYVNNQTRRDLSKFNFKFVELEFINDRFGGFNYRISETAGIGRKLIENDKIKLTIQSSAGLRQTKLTTKDKSDDFLIRFGANFEAKINEHVSFNEYLDISIDQNAIFTRSDANLKILISKQLYVSIGLLVENVTNVPQGRKNSDVTSSMNLGYEF